MSKSKKSKASASVFDSSKTFGVSTADWKAASKDVRIVYGAETSLAHGAFTSAPSIHDEPVGDLNHKERFTRLLGAAVRSPKSSG
jgi:hypothetical protein